ncbi:retropepsin-like domain-containing protein [Dyadobacter sp. CY261]|uniref:retropepsin-like aspartic protease n=1 Tax=Dyadobacter sp. CY261 TaxID=2907203 RepID=UPI001F16F84F|nr:retropepsin-like aspartic protease [Dyadobacter sp. CY261]MCF0070453.1 retropepsin-like domain-containing protein [Dyadobacter sp. CY261]
MIKLFLKATILLVVSHHVNAQETSGRITAKIANNDLFIEAYVNEKGPFNFLVDTGASGIGRIDERIVKELGLTASDSTKNFDGSGRYKIIPVFTVSSLRVAGLAEQNVELLSRNYNGNRSNGRMLIYGIVGRDFFRDYLVTIDSPRGEITYSRDSLNAANEGVIPYQNGFEINAMVGDTSVTLHIDTGSTLALHFPKSVMDRLSHTDTKNKSVARRANSEYFIQQTILHSSVNVSSVRTKNRLLKIE